MNKLIATFAASCMLFAIATSYRVHILEMRSERTKENMRMLIDRFRELKEVQGHLRVNIDGVREELSTWQETVMVVDYVLAKHLGRGEE